MFPRLSLAHAQRIVRVPAGAALWEVFLHALLRGRGLRGRPPVLPRHRSLGGLVCPPSLSGYVQGRRWPFPGGGLSATPTAPTLGRIVSGALHAGGRGGLSRTPGRGSASPRGTSGGDKRQCWGSGTPSQCCGQEADDGPWCPPLQAGLGKAPPRGRPETQPGGWGSKAEGGGLRWTPLPDAAGPDLCPPHSERECGSDSEGC